jgi:hypothetical protein
MPALNAHMPETAAVCMLQALLPEALIPLSLLMPASSASQVGVAAAAAAAAKHKGWGAVLCGDPQQLGPVVRSHVSSLASYCWQTAATHAVHAAHCWACCLAIACKIPLSSSTMSAPCVVCVSLSRRAGGRCRRADHQPAGSVYWSPQRLCVCSHAHGEQMLINSARSAPRCLTLTLSPA